MNEYEPIHKTRHKFATICVLVDGIEIQVTQKLSHDIFFKKIDNCYLELKYGCIWSFKKFYKRFPDLRPFPLTRGYNTVIFIFISFRTIKTVHVFDSNPSSHIGKTQSRTSDGTQNGFHWEVRLIPSILLTWRGGL